MGFGYHERRGIQRVYQSCIAAVYSSVGEFTNAELFSNVVSEGEASQTSMTNLY